MIPTTDLDLTTLTVASQPTKTYGLDRDKARIRGNCTGLSAMEQVVYLILNTERYDHPIYSWNYGAELASLVGQPKSYVMPEAKRRIGEALTQDDRISSVDGFVFTPNGKRLHVAFTVHTTFGDIQSEVDI